jgi:hypothetical protein
MNCALQRGFPLRYEPLSLAQSLRLTPPLLLPVAFALGLQALRPADVGKAEALGYVQGRWCCTRIAGLLPSLTSPNLCKARDAGMFQEQD